jgi:hypothetical protein
MSKHTPDLDDPRMSYEMNVYICSAPIRFPLGNHKVYYIRLSKRGN